MKNIQKNFLALIISTCFLLLATLGCSQIQKAVQDGQSGETKNPITSNSSKGSASSGLSEKSNLYIEKCFNNYSNSMMGSYREYESWIKDIESGPTGKESNVYGLYKISGDGQDCIEAVDQAKKMQPSLPEMEVVADEYAKVLKDSVAQVNGIYPYYDQKDYKDDNFARGKQAHPALLKSFKDFEAVNKKFGDEVDKLEDKVAEAQLAKLEGDSSHKFDYLLVKSGMSSKKIAMLVQRTEYEDLKADELQTLIDNFDQNTNELKAAASSSGKSMASSYISSCEGLLKASKDLMRRIRDKQPFSDYEKRQVGTSGGWTVSGSPDKVIHEYNDMIRSRGFLRF